MGERVLTVKRISAEACLRHGVHSASIPLKFWKVNRRQHAARAAAGQFDGGQGQGQESRVALDLIPLFAG